MCSINNMQKGFTLIEVIIYIALFSLLMGTAFVTAFQLIDGSGKLGVKNTVQEEGNFVMRKINWALTGAENFTIPFGGDELTIERYTGPDVEIKLGSGADVGKILMDGIPLTTENVQVTSLQFTQVGTNPVGVLTTIKIKTVNTNPLDFIITKYIRK